jgi:peptidoglycan/LPS O-acetylase OafA/YrhL
MSRRGWTLPPPEIVQLERMLMTAVQSLPSQRQTNEPGSSAGGRSGFRPDVEGLRAVAVGMVVLYHAGLSRLPGGFVGVDVFFVISGFLITSLLIRELERTGRISLSRFYARRAKRLLPAAAIVLLATTVLTALVLPQIRWRDTGGDIVSAALYVVGWRLAGRSVDYLAEDTAPSPVQHFWSLAVEEQYYLVWPLLLILVTWWARRRGRSMGTSLSIGLALVAIPSLLWSVYQTSYQPASAFFITTTRMWELAIGGGVAIAATRLARMPRPGALLLGWIGLAAVAVAGVIFSTSTPWPGYAAALPTLGAAAVIAAGFAAGGAGPVLLLGTRPFQWVGALSYSLYLWHWPLLVAATAHWGDLSLKRGLAVAALSVVPAWVTYRLVENPLRHSPAISRSPRLALSLGANFSLLGVVAGLGLVLALPSTTGPGDGGRFALGATILSTHPRNDPAGAPVDKVSSITPDPLRATEDVPDIYHDGCQQSQASSKPVSCVYGRKDAPTTVALVGDSKAAQWLPALQILAQAKDWRIVTYSKSACAFSTASTSLDGRPYESCSEWNAKVLDRLTGPDRPDFVITSQVRPKALDGGANTSVDAMVAGLRAAWGRLTAAGVDVFVLRDTPQTGMQVYACVAENSDRLTRCTYDREEGIAASAAPTQVLAAKGMEGVHVIDMTDAICPTERCAPVIGNVLIYRQGSHLTATYVESLAPRLGEELASAGLGACGAGETATSGRATNCAPGVGSQ